MAVLGAPGGDQGLIDYGLWRPGSPDGVGDVYRGRVTAIVPAMAGAFVRLDGQDGFLPDSRRPDGMTARDLTVGTILTVTVTRAALGGKGARLSGRVDTVEGGPSGLRRRGPDPLRELAARHPAADILVDDPGLAATLKADLGSRVSIVPHAFSDEIETEVEALASSEVTLDQGGRFSVHPTPALVAIDVDGGGGLMGADAAGARHRAVNTKMVPEVARQIRLRNLSGAIMVDLAGLKAKQRASFAPHFAAALADDPLRPKFLGFTALGLAEIVRPRVRPPLHELLSGPLAAGLLACRTLAGETRADPGRRLALRCAPGVISALEADGVALADLARVTGRRLNSRADPGLGPDRWRIEEDNG